METIQAIPQLSEQLPLRILLAEDNRVNQQVGLLMLEQLGYRADAVPNGLEVMQSLRRQPYDVVLMDVQMPEIDGLTATRQICQEWSPGQRPQIIAMTAYATNGYWEQCLEAGMDDYISKPIEIEKLVQALSQCQRREQGSKAEHSCPSAPLPLSPPALLPLSPLDAKTLQSLRKMAGARANEVLAQIINNYLEEAPQLLQADACRCGDRRCSRPATDRSQAEVRQVPTWVRPLFPSFVRVWKSWVALVPPPGHWRVCCK